MKDNSTGLLNKFANNIGKAVKSLSGIEYVGSTTQYVGTNSYRSNTPSPSREWLFNQGEPGVDIFFGSGNNLSSIQKSYECCPTVYAIVNQQAYTFTTGDVVINDLKGNLGKGAWVEKVKKILKNPNPLQNWKQFESQLVIFTRLFGYCPILPIIPVGYALADAESLWIIPPYMLEIEYSKTIFYNVDKGESYIKKITIKYGDEVKEIPNDAFIIIRDITPGFNNVYLPSAPIIPLRENINNLIGLTESRGTLTNYRGALGILTPEIDPSGAIAGSPDDEDDLQNSLMQYGLLKGQRKIIIANAAMKWQQIGTPYKDLQISEWSQDEIMAIADGLTFPYKLLSNQVSGSMNGTEIDSWKKKLYDDFTIPFADMIYEQLSAEFEADINGFVIKKSFAKVSVLQTDDLKKSQSRKTRNEALQIEFYNNLINLNRWLELNEEPAMADQSIGAKYYWELVKEGWAFGQTGFTLQAAPTETTTTTTGN